MEIPSWIPCVGAWIICSLLLLLLLLLHPRRRNLNQPPGPKPWPFIGNLNLISPLPHRSIHKLSKKYGPIMQLRFGSFPVVVASSVDTAKLFLKTHDLVFASRPKNSAGKHLFYNYSDILWSPYGPYWRQARKICILELFTTKRIESYEYIRKEEIMSLLKALYKSSGKSITLKDYLSTLNFNVISRMVLGKNYTDKSENAIVSPDEFRKMIKEFFFVGGAPNIGDSIPWLDFLDLQGYVKRMKALNKKFDRFLEHVLDEHNERRNGIKDYVAKDMVDVLLQLADDPDIEVKFQRQQIKGLTLDLLAAGTESSAETVVWAISELLKNPEIFNKATEELDRVIGKKRWVEEQDMINLPYIDAILKETMRLHPVAPLLASRIAREDCQIGGYDIAKGTRVLVNTWTIGRDPCVWENPNEFYPERFINGKKIDVKGQDFELLPFGSGRRMCPGYNLALKIIHSSLANLLHGFSWKLALNMKNEDLNMEETFGLSAPRKIPLIVVAQPQLPLSLFTC